MVAARIDQKLRLVVPEQLTTGLIEIQSAADYPLYLPTGWKVAKGRDCHFIPYGPPRLMPRQQRFVVNLVAADGAGEPPALEYGGSPGSTAADAVPEPNRVREPVSGPDRDPRPDLPPNLESSRDIERVRTLDREARQPRPRPVSPDPDGAPAPAAESVKSYKITEGGNFIPRLPPPNSCLTVEKPSELQDLQYEFRHRFNDGTRPLSATTLLKARLDTGNIPPISFPPRRLSPAMQQVVRSAVAQLDAKDITEPGVGQWGSPMVMVKKTSGAWRLCCDYREVNKHVVIPQPPLPRMDDIVASFKGTRYVSAMDMCHGFYQIEIEEEDRPKISFVTPDCQPQYRRLPFGFASSRAIFQRMVDMVLGGMKWVFAVGRIDDIIVYSDTWADHLTHLLQRQMANLELHPGKCAFGA